MYRPHHPPPITWATAWFGISLATFFGQLAMGTEILYALLSLTIFLLIPVVYRLYHSLDNIGGLVFLATFSKLFLVSQWLKIMFFQAADSNLANPEQTVLVLLLGLISFGLAGLIMWPLVADRQGLLRPPHDPSFLLNLALAALGITLLALLARHYMGLSKLGNAEYGEGRGIVVLAYATQLSPLAVAALTARAAILSDRRRFIDTFVITALGLTVLQGVWENLRTTMMAGGVAFACTYLAYGGRIRGIHIALVIIMGIAMQLVIFPVIDIQRGFSSNMTVGEFFEHTQSVATEMLDPQTRAEYEYRLDRMYLSWDTRLYYGDPQGFLDRFAPSAIDETITLFEEQDYYGIPHLISQAAYLIPNMLLKPFGLERPPNTGQLIEIDVFGQYTFMNYGIFAETFASAGYLLFIPACVIISVVYFSGFHFLYGPIRNNYFATYCFSTCYFTFASGDMRDALPQISVQGIVNLAFFIGIVFLSGKLPLALGKEGSRHT